MKKMKHVWKGIVLVDSAGRCSRAGLLVKQKEDAGLCGNKPGWFLETMDWFILKMINLLMPVD